MASGSPQGGVDSAHDSESIRSLRAIKFAFRKMDFEAMEADLLAREERFKRELEEKEATIGDLQLVGVEKIKLEDELHKSKKECSDLRKDLQFSNEKVIKGEQEIIRLKTRVNELDFDKSRAEHDLDLLKLKHEYEVSDHKKNTEYEIGVWEKRYKVLEGRVRLIMEDVAKLSGCDARMDCELNVRREVGQGVVLEESGMATENAEDCKHVSGNMRQELGVGDSCSQKLVNEDRLSASSGPGLDVRGAEDVSKMCDKGVPTVNAEDHKQASGRKMRQEEGDSCVQKLVNEDVSKMCDRSGSDVKRGADTCGHGEKIVSKASGDGGSSCKLIDDNENGMAAISGNKKSIPKEIIEIVDSDDEDEAGSCEVLANKMATKQHVDITVSGENVVGNENSAPKRKQPASVNGDGNDDGGSRINDQDLHNSSMRKCQKLTQGTNAGGKASSTPSQLDAVHSMKQEKPSGSLFKSPMPAGKFNAGLLYVSDGSSSSSSSDEEDADLQFEVPTCFIPNVAKTEQM